MNIVTKIKNCLKRLLKPSAYYPHIDSTSLVGKNVMVYNKDNFILEEHTKVDHYSIIMNTNARFILKKYSGCAVNLTVITGNHPQFPGRFYRTISKKREGLDISLYDKDVVVNEDVWVGCNVTLLSGVHIGRCSVVAAGSVVTKSMPPYCIIGGVPAKPIKVKWSMNDIMVHEQKLFSDEERYTREQLIEEFAKYNLKPIE